MKHRSFAADNMTDEVVADKTGLTKQRVGILEVRAVRVLWNRRMREDLWRVDHVQKQRAKYKVVER